MDAEPLTNPNPRPYIPVGGRGDPSGLGTHLYERVKNGPRGVLIDLRAIGPIAVNHAVQAVIYANSELVKMGTYLSLVPAKMVVERRPSKADRDPEYTESTATVFILCLKDCC